MERQGVSQMILNKLGVITDEVSADLIEALDWTAEQGLKHVEIRMVDGSNVIGLNDNQIRRIRSEVEKRGLFVSAVASPLFKCALDPARPVTDGDRFGQEEEDVAAHFEKLPRILQIAKMLNTKRIRIFSFWREKEPQSHETDIVGHLQRAADITRKEGIQLLLENEPSCNGGYAEEVGRMVRHVNSPALKALWDPGNEQFGSIPFPQGYRQVKDVLGHVHLKDAKTQADGQTTCVPIDSGSVPYAGQFKALLSDGYDGLYTIETHYIPEGGTPMQGTAMTLKGLRNLLKRENLE
jgi:L-ribulose-5-phosphate 3-epimerase